MAGKTLKLEIITPEKVALSEESTSIILPAMDGALGLWPNHAPLLAGLKPGSVKYKTPDGTKTVVIAGGFVEVSNNIVSIIAPAAELSDEIDIDRAQAAKQRAMARLAQRENVDVARAEAALERAEARIMAANTGLM